MLENYVTRSVLRRQAVVWENCVARSVLRRQAVVWENYVTPSVIQMEYCRYRMMSSRTVSMDPLYSSHAHF
jgi:hypothetical protein